VPKVAKELSALVVSRLKKPGMHAVGLVPGLHLQVTDSGARSWILRIKMGDKRPEIGLGGYPAVTLADARQKAREYRDHIRSGRDPVAERRAANSARDAANAAALTFKQCAEKYIEAHEAGWRNAKHAAQWRNTLEQYAYPVVGETIVRHVALPQVLAVLEPIWKAKTETASRLRGRLEAVLDWAAIRGYREADNPARWRGHLDKLLPRPSKVARKKHHPALTIAQIGTFMTRLRAVEGEGAKALEFAILTAARSGEVRGATWSEIDLKTAVWTVPGSRMKAGKEHRVPLSPAAVALLAARTKGVADDLVFESPRGGQLSDMTLTAVLRRLKIEAVPHGFRSTFRDWVAERTNYPNEVAEMALAHAIGDKVEAAYRRGDLFEKRRRMMEDWAAFLDKEEQPAEVVELASRRASSR
jgi:integrase